MIGYRYGAGGAARRQRRSDVVRLDQDELGNDLGVDPARLPLLDTLPASALLWITLCKRAAHRYRTAPDEPLQVWDLPHASVIGADSAGSYLVIRIASHLALQ